MRTRLQHGGLDGAARSELEARLEHFLQEDARIPAALRAFADADREALTALTDASQRDTERLLGNQIPETIALAHSARDLGAFAASAFGAGFGGSVWALIERDRAAAFAERWLDGYREAFPLRTPAVTFLAPPGPPLVRVL